MAYAKKAKETKESEKTYFDITGMKVQNVRVLSETTLAFSLNGKGLGLYNLRVVEGKNGKFISAPQEKGKDGKWYNVYAVYFTDDDEAKLIAEAEAAIAD